MQIGTVGVPLDLATARDFDAMFAQMSAAGMTLFIPMSLHEQVPVPLGTGLEAAFFPPPFGTADAELYDAMRAHGIKMVVPASLIYQPGAPLPAPAADPLVALMAAAGPDLVAAVYTFDEPVLNGIAPDALRAVYEHVKAIAPDMPVWQVNAPALPGQDMGAYLDAVAAAAEWADQVGFSIYHSELPGAGHVTPYSGGATVGPVTAVADYLRWVAEALPDKGTVGILQGFGIADLYADSLLAALDPAIVAAAGAPDLLLMSELARALGGADTLMWFGPSYLDSSLESVWQNVLDVTASLDTGVIDALGDSDGSANAMSEAAAAGAATGLVLDLDGELGETPFYAVDDPRFAVRADGAVVLAQSGALDFETEAEVTLVASARLADGRIATQSFSLAVLDAPEQIRGTSNSEELVGTEGHDAIYGFNGDDWLWGQAGDDRIDGHSGADVLLGEAGRDTLAGGSGDDLLSGGSGDDRLTGGAGADMFLFRENEGYDTVADYLDGTDKIVLVGTAAPVFTASGGSALVRFGGTEVLLEGVSPTSLGLDDFFFLESL